MLLDPLPDIVDVQNIEETTLQYSRLKVKKAKRQEHLDAMQMSRPLGPRIPPTELPRNRVEADEDQLYDLKNELSKVASTVKAFKDWLFYDAKWSRYDSHPRIDPLLALVRVVHLDTKALISNLELSLDEMSNDSLDHNLMTQHLEECRRMMSNFSIAVRSVKESLENFFEFVFHDNLPQPFQLILIALGRRTNSFTNRLKDAHAALRADMAILESRRSITEAQTVTKLTELAFFFIPLTFACSLFSMQITEFPDGVQLKTPLLTALLIALLAYGFRAILQSNLSARTKSYALKHLQSDECDDEYDLWLPSKLSTSTYIKVIARRVWRIVCQLSWLAALLLLLAATFVPISLIWTKLRLDEAFKVMMTLLIVPSGLAVAWKYLVGFTQAGTNLDPSISDIAAL